MADTNSNSQSGNAANATAGEAAGTNGQPQIMLQRIYCRDVSLEVPSAPEIFNHTNWSPNVDVQVDTEVNSLSEGYHQVTLTLTVTTKMADDTVAYLAEVKQAGLFVLSGFEDADQMQAVLGIYCTSTLFPFAREAIADLVQRASFPQLLLQPINFEALYTQHLAEQQQAGGNSQERSRIILN
ncbi:MAG: protein-export chaperone SecB [Sinobacteraceae bacterium]|nr:protein-export chaperone SecB [Nevskiaceae bacterium]